MVTKEVTGWPRWLGIWSWIAKLLRRWRGGSRARGSRQGIPGKGHQKPEEES